jgi:hypothetical protein
MSTSKKTTTKSTKSPAPATKTTAAKPTAATKTVRGAAVRTATPTPVAMLAPSPAPAAKPAVKVVAPKPIVTTITARVDVGFGNALYIRGEGAGLSWEKGLPMECIGNDLWQIVLEESARAYTFKFLVNDATWSTGPDYSAACGTSIALTPEF